VYRIHKYKVSVTEQLIVSCNEATNEKEYFSVKSSVFKQNISVQSIIRDCMHVTYNRSVIVLFWLSRHSPSAA